MAKAANKTFGVSSLVYTELDNLRHKNESFTKYFERVLSVLKEIEKNET